MRRSERSHYNILWFVESPPRYNSGYSFHTRAVRSVSHQTIIVLDFGSQYTQLIARRLRELSVYSEIWPPDVAVEKIRARNPVGIILSGGPKSVSDAGAPRCDSAVFEIGTPVLGICYGMQLMAYTLGGAVAPAPQREFGHATVTVTRQAPLFSGVPSDIRVWASHGDFVAAPPGGFSVMATSANAPVAAMADSDRSLYALLFHPEVVHTEHGLQILRNFAYDVCGCTGDWTMASFVEEATEKVRTQVGDGRVVCALSGGVDSTVAALIIHRAIGKKLTRSASGSNGFICRSCSSTHRPDFSIGWPASSIRRRSGKSSARPSSTSSKRRRPSSGRSTSSRRARFIRTSSNR